jgi:ligand-binding sensor domain-containing protein
VILKLTKTLLAVSFCFLLLSNNGEDPLKVDKIFTVRNGLPQSFVSGIFQDKQGFLWISTLNGLGRYDGREIVHYQHTSRNSAGISGNIIFQIFPIDEHTIWLCYQDGKIDQFNTITGEVVHFWENTTFSLLKNESRYFRSLTGNKNSNYWMMAIEGGLYRINAKQKVVKYFSPSALKINTKILGIVMFNDQLMMLTEKYALLCDNELQPNKKIPYPFGNLIRFNNDGTNIYAPSIRKNGDFIIADAIGLKIWNPKTNFYKIIKLKRQNPPGKLISTFDNHGNYFFEHDRGIFKLNFNNEVVPWSPANPLVKGIPTSLRVDKSDVLWAGTNGFGMRQYNLAKKGLPGYENRQTFFYDVLSTLDQSTKNIAHTFLRQSAVYGNRTARLKDSVWIADVNLLLPQPQLLLKTKSGLQTRTFKNVEKSNYKEVYALKFLTFSKSGILWGIDQQARILKFDTQNNTFQSLAKIALDPSQEINGMAVDEEKNCYISTTRALFRFNAGNGANQELTAALPSKDLLNIRNDPNDQRILWIGTLSDGLIKFNKSTKKSTIYCTKAGLPNNTIYCILIGNDGQLWCSSNRGIFSFNPKTEAVRSFTSSDGLIDDEFNRYNYAEFSNGDLAFGGPMGYTLFNPLKLESDHFHPQIALTGLNIINYKAKLEPLNNLKEIKLSYNQNFITAVFAAMQFDNPEKLKYRYQLKGLDKNWIMLGNENKVSYTSLPPGNYTLILSASNTEGRWSKYQRLIKIVISPPYWQTWWFYLASILIILTVLYLFLRNRIQSIKKVQSQKLQFEREAIELHALALRARMNPHFIFNCLNSIKALIQEKQNNKAVNYLTKFSILTRMQLQNNSNEILLQEELETCKLYLELEEMRFEDRIAFQFHIEQDEELKQTKVPPLILQPIVENAIVHGLLPSETGGLVNITVYRDGPYAVCKIEDNGIGRTAAQLNKEKSNRLHESKGMQLLAERISMHNRLNKHISSLETIDLFNESGKSSGTLVIIKFNLEL